VASNKDIIFARYGGKPEDGREASSRTAALEFYYTKRHMDEYITPEKRVLEIGCATGYYGLHYASRCREYVGIDLYPPHIEIFEQRISEIGLKNVSCHVGDALRLETTHDAAFDVVLCFGPMYHLPPEERKLAFAECARVCKPGGVLAFAYITSVGTYAGCCVYDQWRDTYPNASTTEYVFEKGTDNEKPGLFFFTMPEEIEAAAAAHGLAKIKNLGTSFQFAMKIVDDMSNERFELMKPIYDQLTSYESCTGMSGHALLVCKKQ